MHDPMRRGSGELRLEKMGRGPLKVHTVPGGSGGTRPES